MLNILLNIVGAALLSLIVFGIFVAIEAYYYQGRIGVQLQKEVGFREGATYNRKSRGLESAVTIVDVDEDRIFHRAGFRPGDVLPRESHSSLFRRLHRNCGKEVEFAVVDGGDGPPFHKRPVRTIRLVIPAKQIQN
jgi:hypothetical protein